MEVSKLAAKLIAKENSIGVVQRCPCAITQFALPRLRTIR
jgi:hypothetical protein